MNGTLWKLALPALLWAVIAPVLAETERASAIAGSASTAKVRRVKGDITAVNAGSGLTGGGISGDVTLNVNFFGSGSSDTVARGDHTHGFVGENTAVGAFALQNNGASGNTAVGQQSMQKNTSGSNNSALGNETLRENTGGSFNAAVGAQALKDNISGSFNAAIGSDALSNNTTGQANTAVGFNTLNNNTAGDLNTAVGNQALQNNITGIRNIALGPAAGFNVTGSDNINIGNPGFADESNTIRIGAAQNRTFIDGIRGTATDLSNAIPVVIDSAGQLGTASSSRRFKNDIKPMDQSSESILALRPVTFHYKSDNKATAQFGLIAEEVAQVNPDLVVRDNTGEIYTVRYDAVNAMLLNEFLKQHRKVEEQEAAIATQRKDYQAAITQLQATIAQQQKAMNSLAASLKEQASKIQQVDAQIQSARPALHMVDNNP